ncbi:hypothetical protein SESBI_17491 [Sesbania bispinosa]|nr:hypothetical protein SESBI_17491 [Sesbania bispinosa]
MEQISSSPLSCVIENEATLTGNISSHELDLSMLSDAQYCYSLLEAIPLPGPTWSTTAPSVLAEPPPSAQIEASVELVWGENQASSYTWWLGFLESLDDNMTSHKLDQALGGENNNIGMENSKVLSLESSFVDAIDDWLMIPTMEKDLGDMVLP